MENNEKELGEYIKKEIGKNEIFIGNVFVSDGIKDYLKSLKTIRLGNLALDINGEKLSPTYCLPMFICKSEIGVLENIRRERFKKASRGEL